MKLLRWIAVACLSSSGCAVAHDPADVPEEVATDEAASHTLSGWAAWARGTEIRPQTIESDSSSNVWYVGAMNNPDETFGNHLVRLDPYGREMLRKPLPEGYLFAGIGRDGGVAIATGLGPVTRDFGCGATSANVVVRLDDDGKCLWQRTIDGGSQWYPRHVRLTPESRVVLAGVAHSSVDFGKGAIASDGQIFVASYSPEGAFEWARIFGEPRADRRRYMQGVNDVAIDGEGRIYLGGYHYSTIDFGTGPMVSSTSGAPPGSGFFAVLSKSGVTLRASSNRASAPVEAIAVDAQGRIGLAGTFRGSLAYGEKTLTNTSRSYDVFLAVVEQDGGARWVKKLWGSSVMNVSGIAFDGDGYLSIAGNVGAIAGYETGTFYVGPYDFTVGKYDAYAARFTPVSGATAWARHYQAKDAAEGHVPNVRVNAMAVTPNRRVLLAGVHGGTVDFGRDKVVSGEGGFVARIYP